MQLKKTKKGKFSFQLDYEQRDKIASLLMSFLESESVDLLSIPLVKKEDFTRHIFYAAANHFLIRFSPKFFAPSRYEQFLLSRLEALVLVRLMGNTFNQDMNMLDLRNQLLKALS